MDFSIFHRAKRLFDLNTEPVAELPYGLNAIIAKTEAQALRPYILDLWKDIDPHWDIAMEDMTNHAYDIDTETKIITVNSRGYLEDAVLASPYFAPQILLNIIEAARMVRHIEWIDDALDRYHPESIVKIGRICVADSITQMIAMAWEARGEGYDNLWKHSLCGAYTDMAQCYDRVMERTLTQGYDYEDATKEALSLTFRTWFTDPDRVNACDRDSMDMMDDMIFDEGRMGKNQIDPATAVCLTLQVGDDTSYLPADITRDIVTNPFYGAVEDPINHTHLTQIIRDNQVNEVSGIPFRDETLARRFSLT